MPVFSPSRLPRSVARTLAVYGDSITAQNTDATVVNAKTNIGYAVWAGILSAGTFQFDVSLNFGVNGDTSTQGLARIGTVLAAQPGVCVVEFGINDPANAVSYATTTANLLAMWTQLAAAGIQVIALTLMMPNTLAGTTPVTAATHRQLNRISNYIRNVAPTIPGVIVVDPWANIIDNTLGTPLGLSTAAATAYTYDGLHPSPRGAFWIGRGIADALSPNALGTGGAIYPTRLNRTSQTVLDVYNASDNPSGNRINSIQSGAFAGSVNANCSGNAPTGFTLQRDKGTVATAGGSSTTSPLTNGQNLTKARLVVTAPAGGASDGVQLSMSVALTAGDIIYGACDVDVTAITADSLVAVQLMLRPTSVFTAAVAGCGTLRSNFVLPNQTWSGTLMFGPYTVPTTGTYYFCVEPVLMGSVPSAGVTLDTTRTRLWSV